MEIPRSRLGRSSLERPTPDLSDQPQYSAQRTATVAGAGADHATAQRRDVVEALPGSGGSFTQSLASLDGLVTLASTAQREILGSVDVVLDTHTAQLLQCQTGSRWHHIFMVRRETGRAKPLGWTDAHVDPP